jgi:hypothetical protein
VSAAADRLRQAHPELSRTALSRAVCEELDWRGPGGALQEMQCRVVLNRLERAGDLDLPAARRRMPRHRHRRRNDPRSYRMPDSIIVGLRDLGEISLVRVTSESPELSAEWRELTGRHHYLGSGPLCGRQLRYLVQSEHYGRVGTLAFTSAALNLEARDNWIGWNTEARDLHLGEVVCNARFLILPWVKVMNLASKVLSLCPERVRADWLDTYAVEPVLLETFVDPVRFRGTCYTAAGWECIGSTKGRGRQDRENECPTRRKQVFVHPIRDDFREILTTTPPKRPVPVYYLAPEERHWAEVEFAEADLGDVRRTQRLTSLAAAFFRNPTAPITEACGSEAAARAAYRFFRNSRVTMQNILAPHYEATAGRVAAEGGVVLAVQDTTFLNYTAHAATEGLGPIGSTENGPVGIVVHDTMAFTPDGTPLGLVNIQCWARDPKEFGLSDAKKNLPVEYKESVKWIESWEAASRLQQRVPEARVVSVGDREADMYELFERAAAAPDGARLLVRATQNRRICDEELLLKDSIRARPANAVIAVEIPRRADRPAAAVPLEMRFGSVELQAPKKHNGRPSLPLQFVHVIEETPRNPADPIEWFLLTDCPVQDLDAAREVLGWYTRRWGIEIYHRIIKSGCRVEERLMREETRLENCLAIDLVVAWRIFHLTMLGRECPQLPATVCLDDVEWKILAATFAGSIPEEPPSIGEAVLWVARLGGYIARPKDHRPGPTVMWRGLTTLQHMSAGWRLYGAIMPAGP